MQLDRKALKAEAKDIVKNARVSAYLFTLLFMVIVIALTALDNLVGTDVQIDPEVQAAMSQYGFTLYTIPPLVKVAAPIAGFIGLFVSFMNVVLSAGYLLYHLGIREGKEMPYATLFDGFTFVGKLILLAIVTSIFVFLWTLLFIIPGIIAGYRYRFAMYNLCENPEIGVMDALRMSKAQTAGFKWQLFVLDLSFLGWGILCGLTAGILSIWVTPWMQQTNVGYFLECKRITGVGSFPQGPGGGEGDGTFQPWEV